MTYAARYGSLPRKTKGNISNRNGLMEKMLRTDENGQNNQRRDQTRNGSREDVMNYIEEQRLI